MTSPAKAPEIPMAQPEENTVLYCVKKKGPNALFKYIPLGSCRIKPGDRTLDEVIRDYDAAISLLKGRIQRLETKLGITAELAVLTAERKEE